MTAGLRPVDHVFLNFGNKTFQWVDVRRFALPAPATDDAAILAMLINHELYGHDHAGGDPGGDPHRHGPYWRNRITPACYDPIDPDTAERRLRSWAEQFAPVPERLRPDLEQKVYQPLRSADSLYELRDLGPEAFHDWGSVHNEFHELVLINQATHALTLVVASDD